MKFLGIPVVVSEHVPDDGRWYLVTATKKAGRPTVQITVGRLPR